MKRVPLKKRLSWASQLQFLAIALVTAAVVAGAGMLVGMPHISLKPTLPQPSSIPIQTPVPSLVAQPVPSLIPAISSPVAKPSPIVQPSLTSSPAPAVKSVPLVKPYFGHLPYAENDLSRLVDAGKFIRGTYERNEALDFEANEAFQSMTAAARAENVFLMPISGFRTIADQKVLYEKQIARRGSEEAAAKWSAPPGYSEHHTGYAIDIGDMDSDTDLKMTFQDTEVYRWLKVNARSFGFEESFSYNNQQGVSFEPWHWRYVNSARAGQIFSVAHSYE
jgi:zinc D-Ala-D-Ala carboxypeptidase